MSGEDEVRAASAMFYAALNQMLAGDAAPIAKTLWHDEAVTAMHPNGGLTIGWHDIEDTFIQFAKMASGGPVDLVDQRIHMLGDMAYELGREKAEFTLAGFPVSMDQRVTNIYRREAGAWKMTHHHTDVCPGIVEALAQV